VSEARRLTSNEDRLRGYQPSNLVNTKTLTPTQLRFYEWLNRRLQITGRYMPGFHAINWYIGTVLVTLWLRNGAVKLYHHGGLFTDHYFCHTEACRADIMALIESRHTC